MMTRRRVRIPRLRLGRVRVGVTISPTRLVAVELRRGVTGLLSAERVWIRALTPLGDADEWRDLADAFEELAAEIGACGTLDVALARPLAWAKIVRPPPVSRRDVVPLLVRNVRRYLLAAPGPLAADATLLGRGSDGARLALVACAPAGVVDAVWCAAEATGWRMGVLTTASLGLAAGATRLDHRLGRASAVVAASSDDWREGVVLECGRPVSAEGWSRLGETEVHERASTLAAERGGTALVIDGAGDTGPSAAHPGAVAAVGVATLNRRPPLLVPAAVRALWRRTELARAAALASAALLLFAGAQALRVIGLDRELAAVRAERAALAPRVRDALAARAAADGLRKRLRAIDIVQDSVRSWTPVVAALARALPDSAYLMSLSVKGAEVQLVGLAPSASDVVPALSASQTFASVALRAPVERVATSGERFDIGASIAGGAAGSSRGGKGSGS